MHKSPNILQQIWTSLLKNIPTGTSHPSWRLHHLIDSSDRLPIICWPLTMFVCLKFRRHTPKASTWSFDGIICIYLVTEKVPHISGEPYMVEQVREAAEYIFEGNDPCFEILGPR